MSDPHVLPTLLPLGDSALLVRFGSSLSDAANRRAQALARQLDQTPLLAGVSEICQSLVSVLLRYDPRRISFAALAGEVRLLLSQPESAPPAPAVHRLAVRFDGADVDSVAALLGLDVPGFVRAHTAEPLRVLATGFAPGFVYCGFHPETLRLQRRPTVRPLVPAGTVLFAAGQTAIAATPIPTGWHVIGHTDFANFDATRMPPMRLAAGDTIVFEAMP